MKKGLICMAILLALSPPALAQDNNGAVETFVRTKLESVLSHLRNKALEKEERNRKILLIVNESFDFLKMAKLSLGKRYWLRLKKLERQRYVSLFISHLQKTYLDKLDLYTDEVLVINQPVHVKKKVHILTEMVSSDNRIGILYKLYRAKKKGWRIYDVEVEGVSLITTYRSQFNEVLRKGTIQDLLVKLENSDKE